MFYQLEKYHTDWCSFKEFRMFFSYEQGRVNLCALSSLVLNLQMKNKSLSSELTFQMNTLQ